MTRYIHQLSSWPRFSWNHESILPTLASVRAKQGRLMGRMESLGFSLRSEAMLKTLTADIIKSSEIEGIVLNTAQVRSSVARRLGMEVGGLVSSDRDVDGVVEMMLDATQLFNNPLTKKRLFDWHASLFPTGRSGMRKINVASWRDDRHGPMQVVSGPVGKQRVHFEAPEASRLGEEMRSFLEWFNEKSDMDPTLKSALAHFWFVTIHPFEDGNGRIARAITDMQLSRADQTSQRFYSISVQICKERNDYYDVLEKNQKNTNMNVTGWVNWFLECLIRALDSTDLVLNSVMKKAVFWEKHPAGMFNPRQMQMIGKLLDGFDGHLTSSKWAKITKCSQDTALRDMVDLMDKKVLLKLDRGGRSTCYLLLENSDQAS